MDAPIPLTWNDIVTQIVTFTGAPRDSVEARVWAEALDPGFNVAADVRRFGVTPHRYDERMEALYREGDGFIYETLVFWARSMRRQWTEATLERVEALVAARGLQRREARVLLLGDGTGNDSLAFVQRGYHVDYFDVPGSRTFDFACRRFQHFGLLGESVRVVPEYSHCLSGSYDVVVCLEVLEHLPDPVAAISDVRRMLNEQGIALVTEAFGYVSSDFPTHVEANRRLEGTLPLLFLRQGMALSWYNRLWPFKPMEFRPAGVASRSRLSATRCLLADRAVFANWLLPKVRRLRSGVAGLL